MKNILLLISKPRTGKSTCIKKIINLLERSNCDGFYTDDFYKEFATCSHIMAVESLIKRLKDN